MGRRTVDLVEYSPDWSDRYLHERARLSDAFGAMAIVIEHIGSTAVPGLIAKPTIDIAVGVEEIGPVSEVRERLEQLGYEWRAGFHAEHLFLRRIEDDERTHHLHVTVYPSAEFDRWLAFRDYLRANPDAAKEYADVKRELAARFYNDRGGYVEAKSEVVERILQRALV